LGDAGKTIFLIEDSKEIRTLVQILFESEGYAVASAHDGHDALDKLRSMPKLPSLILLDLMMPVMDGYQFRQEQLKDPLLATIPVYIMTADGNVDVKAAGLGVEGGLRKPVDIETLLEVAEKHC